MLLGLQVCHPSGALELDLIEGPFQLGGKGGDLLITPLAGLVEVLLKNIKTTVPKMTNSLCSILATLAVGPMYLAISAVAPFNDQIILSQTTAYG